MSYVGAGQKRQKLVDPQVNNERRSPRFAATAHLSTLAAVFIGSNGEFGQIPSKGTRRELLHG